MYRILSYETIDNLIIHVSEIWHKFKAAFSEQLIREVVLVYNGIFEFALLKNELSLMAQKTSKENLLVS
jgi:hypothetical protein